MSSRSFAWPQRWALLVGGCASSLLLSSCALQSGARLEEDRARVRSEIEAEGLVDHPAIEAATEELNAALERERSEVAIDEIEVRAALVRETENKVQTLARLPLRNPFELREHKKARRAQSESALARLDDATLTQRVARCVPSVDYLVQLQQEEIYGEYAERHRALLDWNRELRDAGRSDEVSATRFELESHVKLTARDPSTRAQSFPAFGPSGVLDALPEPRLEEAPLRIDPEIVRKEILGHLPMVAVHRGEQRRFEALARRENMKRVPTPRFIDVGYEPVVFTGDEPQLEARIAFEIPLGREASAMARSYSALARGKKSEERALVELRHRSAALALSEVNSFRVRAAHWLALSALANRSEEVADRWWQGRLAGPRQISGLLDSVYDARLAVLDARRRAGRAACMLIEATGVGVEQWPR